MSTILNTAIAGINAMKTMINHTASKINQPHQNNTGKRVFIENSIQDSNLNTTVKVREIYDNYNDFITEEKRQTDAKVQDEQTKIEQLLKLENLLCEKSNIFNELVYDAYQAIEKGIASENNDAVNENIIAKLNNVVLSLKDFDEKLKILEKDVKESVINNLKKVNSLIDEIHDITIDIHYFPILKHPNQIGTLLDKRENLVNELNELIGVKVIKNNDDYKISLNNGINIIDNNKKQNLIPLTSKSDEKYISIGYIDSSNQKVKKIEDMIPSSSLGALLRFRREELASAKNKIGQLTANLAESINSYPTLGNDDTFGHLDKKILNLSNPEIIPSSTNHASPKTSAIWVSTNDAKDTDYVLYFKNNNWFVIRLSDHMQIQANINQNKNLILITFDGIEFSIERGSADGDVYMIRPYSKTLEKLALLINQNNPFYSSSKNDADRENENRTAILKKFHEHFSMNKKQDLNQAYQNFSTSITNECNSLEEELPFKKNMIEILRNKKALMSDNIEENYQNINYQQECYLANVKVLETAENIFNEIIDCYS